MLETTLWKRGLISTKRAKVEGWGFLSQEFRIRAPLDRVKTQRKKSRK